MEGLIGGAIIGVTAALVGPALVSGLFKVVIPAGEKMVQGSVVAVTAVAGLFSSFGTGVLRVVEPGRESKEKPSSEERGFLKRLKSLAKIL